jgi:isoleucyl-tRNA synthetase
MPYASWHYPFENKKKVESIFPADFIAEGLDQTRGWFYTLHVLATALTSKKSAFGKDRPAFKNVIVNGLILDEFGRKLSKKLRNYTEPEMLFDKTGADAVRFFLLSSTSIGEDYRFSDKGVMEVKTRISDRLLNSYNFFAMYADKAQRAEGYKSPAKETELDKWIKARFKQAAEEINRNMEKYELTQATRPITDLLDDLSNWYIRRSRTRLQRPDNQDDFYAASKTLYDCLITASKLMAPFTPFISEAVYKSLTSGKESVHLEDWPNLGKTTKEEESLIEAMIYARVVASQALAKRAEAGIKVKQPLSSYKTSVKELAGKKGILALIADEANVKEVAYDAEASAAGILDIEITAELREEGMLREIARIIQDMRQKAEFKPKEKAVFHIQSDDEEINKAVSRNAEKLKEDFSLSDVVMKKDDDMKIVNETKVGEAQIWAGIK